MADYEKQFRQADAVCGPTFPEFRAFFAEYGGAPLRVLDLGCGQGRDTLMIARLGHTVHAIDLAPTGIKQVMEDADRAGLSITGEVADVRHVTLRDTYDVVVLDRVLHQFGSDDDRDIVLRKAVGCVRPGGYVLVSDTPAHLPQIRAFFEHRCQPGRIAEPKRGFLFVQLVARIRGGDQSRDGTWATPHRPDAPPSSGSG